MAGDFKSARYWAAEMIEPALYDGAVCVDATMGNGHDTLWLCERVAPKGRVYAFDVQEAAVRHTRERLAAAGQLDRATLFCEGHQRMAELVPEPADAILFNLGWLPGAEHGVTTRTETTLEAVNAALGLLKPEGLLSVCVYPGHEEGARERDALIQWASSLDEKRYDALLKCYLNQSNHPPLWLGVRRKRIKTSPRD